MKSIVNRLLSVSKVTFSVIIIIYSVRHSVAQSNLVLNPSFELHHDTVDGIFAFYRNYVTYWSDPNTGSSDLFAPNTLPTQTIPPHNTLGFEYPHSGFCYAGFAFYAGATSLAYEYVQASFTSPLIAGQTYGIESYVSMAYEGQSLCASDLGFYFSDTQMHVDASPFGYRIPVIPQFENPSSNMITTYNGWQRITGNYTSHGGERYLSIGSFTPYTMMHIDTCSSRYPDRIAFTYLFIDDVAVYDTSIIDTIRLCLNDSIQIGGNWQHLQGMYFDTIGGLTIKHYVEYRPYTASLTVLTRPFEYGDSIKVPLLQKEGNDSSYEVGLHNYLFVKNDTIIDIPMFNIYGCDSTVRYICGWHIGIGNELINNLLWSIYPNPSNDFIEVKLNINDPTKYAVTIIDIAGREVLTHSLANNKIDISVLKCGMYFIKLINTKTGNVVGTEKFVKSN